MGKLTKLLRFLALAAKYGARIARRILQLEGLIDRLRSRVATLMRLAARFRRQEKFAEEAHTLARARAVEEQLNDAIRRVRRLLEGLSEAGP